MLFFIYFLAGYKSYENAQKELKSPKIDAKGESRQGMFTATKFNLAAAKTILTAAREKLTTAVNFRIKWR